MMNSHSRVNDIGEVHEQPSTKQWGS